jgi:hypothetical protein
MADQDKLLNERLSAAEMKVSVSRTEGLAAARAAAQDAASAIVEKLAGVKMA